jgi:hypothetical protein
MVPNGEEFSPELLVSKQLPKSQKIVDEKQADAIDFLMLVTRDGKLNVNLLGHTPLASWIPIKGSTTLLKYEPGMHLDNEGLASIEEHYKEYPAAAIRLDEDKKEVSWDDSIEYPLGDFLGPNLVFWSSDSTAYLRLENEVLFNGRNEDTSSHRIIAVVIGESAFSVRVACQPFGEDELEAHAKDSNGRLIIPRRVRDSGKITINVSNPEGQAGDFDQIYNVMKTSPTVEVSLPCACNVDQRQDISETNVGFRYPPLPPNEGFNIFGPIGQLKLTSALGKIMVGSHSFDIAAPSKLELRNIESLEVEGGVISIPIQLKTHTREANFELRGTSEVYINDESLNKKADEYKPVTEYLTVISGVVPILSFLATVASVLFDRSKSTSSVK